MRRWPPSSRSRFDDYINPRGRSTLCSVYEPTRLNGSLHYFRPGMHLPSEMNFVESIYPQRPARPRRLTINTKPRGRRWGARCTGFVLSAYLDVDPRSNLQRNVCLLFPPLGHQCFGFGRARRRTLRPGSGAWVHFDPLRRSQPRARQVCSTCFIRGGLRSNPANELRGRFAGPVLRGRCYRISILPPSSDSYGLHSGATLLTICGSACKPPVSLVGSYGGPYSAFRGSAHRSNQPLVPTG